MGLFDKVKAQALELKDKAEGTVEQIQARRRATDLLDDLGRFLYAERTGRPVTGSEAEITRIVAELATLEKEGVQILPEG